MLYYYLGLTYYKLNKYNFAMDSFNKAILLDEFYADAHYYLGLMYESILKYDKALFHYKKAKAFNTTFKKLNFNYGNLLYNMEQYKKSIKPLKDYMSSLADLGEAINNLDVSDSNRGYDKKRFKKR